MNFQSKEANRQLVFLDSIKEQLSFISDDTTCPLHIAAQIDQIVELAESVKAVGIPPVNIGDTVYYIVDGQIRKAKVSFLHWSQNSRGTTSEIGGVSVISGSFSYSAHFEDWGKSVFSDYKEAAAVLGYAKLSKNH